MTEVVAQRCSVRKGVLRNFAEFAGKQLCQSLYFIKKETLAQLLSCKFWEISKNTFVTEHLWVIASLKNSVNYFKIRVIVSK